MACKQAIVFCRHGVNWNLSVPESVLGANKHFQSSLLSNLAGQKKSQRRRRMAAAMRRQTPQYAPSSHLEYNLPLKCHTMETRSKTGLYDLHIDPDKAKELVRSGGTLLLLGVPQGTVLGLDHQSNIVGPKFKGIKMIPPGAHVLAYNSISRQGDFSATTSFFIHVHPGKIVVRRWEAESEVLVPLKDHDEEERYENGVRRMDFDKGLAPYNLHVYPVWKSLCSNIDADTINRLSPAQGNISITAEAGPLNGATSAAEERLASQLAGAGLADNPSGLAENPSQPSPSGNAAKDTMLGRCHYTHIDRDNKGRGEAMSSAELTEANLDKSRMLEALLDTQFEGNHRRLLGELQFAFLAFLLGQSLEGFAQWKEILQLLFNCDAAVLKRTALFIEALEIIEAQIRCSMTDLNSQSTGGDSRDAFNVSGSAPMVDELIQGSFLKQLFAGFLETLQSLADRLDPTLKAQGDRLQKTLEELLGWNFQLTELDADSDDEYAPVIVDL